MKWFIPATLFLLTACKTIEPAQPASANFEAPKATQPKSTIVLPLSINLSGYFTMADKQVPFSFDGSDKPCAGVQYSYHFERDPIKLTADGQYISIGVTGKYRIKMSYCVDCTDLFGEPSCVAPRIPFSCGYGEPMRRVRLEYQTSFKLTENYGLETHTNLKELKAVDPCEVTVFHYDATEQLLKEVEKSLAKLAKDIDKSTKAVNFKKEAQQLWNQASQPQYLAGFGYIQLRPKNVYMVKPVVKQNVLKTALVIDAYPLFSSTSGATEKSSVPDLQFIDHTKNDTLEIITDIELSYDSLSSIINRYTAGNSFMIQDKQVIIDSIHITGTTGQRLIFRVQFSGKKKGTLFLTGKPVFDPVTQQIELADVAFDLDTKSVLLKSAKWLFSDRILQEIQKASKQDLKPQFTKLKAEMNKSFHFTQDDFKLKGNITELKVDHIYPETSQLKVRVRARGNMLLTNIND